ncbi:hypothetical protein [Cupriavidus necator]
MERVAQGQVLRAAVLKERETLQAVHRRAFAFEAFLRERASRGDEAALAALRRSRRSPGDVEQTAPTDANWIPRR